MSKWLKIETVPMDGTEVLICYPYRGKMLYRCVHAVNGGFLHISGAGITMRSATHWMPLPTPPTGEE